MTLTEKKSPRGTLKPPPGVKITPEREPNYVDPETLQDRFDNWKKKQEQKKPGQP